MTNENVTIWGEGHALHFYEHCIIIVYRLLRELFVDSGFAHGPGNFVTALGAFSEWYNRRYLPARTCQFFYSHV